MSGRLHRGTLVAGIFFAAMGVTFLLDELRIIALRPVLVWPLVLIGLGIAVLAGAAGQSSPD